MYLRNDLKIIDFRCRPAIPEFINMSRDPKTSPKNWWRFGYPCPEDTTVEDFIVEMRKWGLYKGIFMGRHTADGLGQGGVVKGVSDRLVAESCAKSEGMLVGFAGTDPLHEDSAKQLEIAVKELGLLGVSVDHKHYRMKPNDDRLMPLYEKAQELNVPVTLTMGPLIGTKYNDIEAIDDISETFPNLRIVLSHSFYPNPTEFIACAYRQFNVWLEMSIYEFLPGAQQVICEAANSVIQDRIIYASAYPFNPLNTVEMVKKFPLSDDVFEKLFYKNACEVIGKEL